MRRPKPPTDSATRAAWTRFQELPNIGPAMAHDFVRLGLRTLDDLERADAQEMYDRIGRLDGVRHDPCVLDTYAAAIHNLRTGEEQPWWEFSRRRKAERNPQEKRKERKRKR